MTPLHLRPAPLPARRWPLPLLTEAALLLLLGELFWLGLLAFAPPPLQPTLFRLWLLGCGLGWLIGHRRGPRFLLQPERLTLTTPLWALAASAALLVATGHGRFLLLLLPLHLLWLALGTLLVQGIQREAPPLRAGVTQLPSPFSPGTGNLGTGGWPTAERPGLPAHPRLTYVPLDPQNPAALNQIDVLLLEPERAASAAYQRLLEHAHVTKVPVWPRSLAEEEITGKVTLHQIDRNWLDASAFRSRYEPFKRAFDVLSTLLLLPVLLPLLALVALTVRVNSGRPILFWQERIGRDGRPFRLVKFRTMTTDSERQGAAFAQKGDQRVTPVGQFLRKFRLDELPQFWNVLRGEMSIIGPRPEQWAFAADFEEHIPLYACRHWVRPGITGWAQVNQGYTDSLGQTTEKLQYDFYYVKHLSLSLDVAIVTRTIHTILTGFGSR